MLVTVSAKLGDDDGWDVVDRSFEHGALRPCALTRGCGYHRERVRFRAIMGISAPAILLADRPRRAKMGHQYLRAPGPLTRVCLSGPDKSAARQLPFAVGIHPSLGTAEAGP